MIRRRGEAEIPDLTIMNFLEKRPTPSSRLLRNNSQCTQLFFLVGNPIGWDSPIAGSLHLLILGNNTAIVRSFRGPDPAPPPSSPSSSSQSSYRLDHRHRGGGQLSERLKEEGLLAENISQGAYKKLSCSANSPRRPAAR